MTLSAIAFVAAVVLGAWVGLELLLIVIEKRTPAEPVDDATLSQELIDGWDRER